MLEAGKIVNGELQVKFEGIDDRDQAFTLRGYTIEIPRESFAPTEENEYYWADLVGMTVINKENIVLGKVSNLMETGANDVLMIKGEHGQILIPFVQLYRICRYRQQNHYCRLGFGLLMLIQAITIFPEMFDSIVEYGVTGRARKQNLWQFQATNPRKFADNKLGYIDDRPFGGGPE